MTNSVQSNIDRLIAQARDGDSSALGQLLEHHRGYLKVLAQRMLGVQMQPRLDASDVVQRTCLSVQKAIAEFRGTTTPQFLVWLRQIHEGNVQNALREHLAGKRDVGREANATAAEIESVIIDSTQSTPSQRVLRDERAVRLAAELDSLPEDQREAIRLRYLEGLSLTEVGVVLNRSTKAASALILRGMVKLKGRLNQHMSSR